MKEIVIGLCRLVNALRSCLLLLTPQLQLVSINNQIVLLDSLNYLAQLGQRDWTLSEPLDYKLCVENLQDIEVIGKLLATNLQHFFKQNLATGVLNSIDKQLFDMMSGSFGLLTIGD